MLIIPNFGANSSINMNELISIGSLGRNYDTIQEVHVQNCKFTSTTNGARIKTFAVSNIYIHTLRILFC